MRNALRIFVSNLNLSVYFVFVENLAKKKPITSSSYILYGAAWRATDRNMASLSMTRVENNPWVKVDLLKIYLVHEILIFAPVGNKNKGNMDDLNIRIPMRLNGIQNNTKQSKLL